MIYQLNCIYCDMDLKMVRRLTTSLAGPVLHNDATAVQRSLCLLGW
eukprot:SAG31_NODE_18222_length_643_cov_0.856618_1_plen_45_part_01